MEYTYSFSERLAHARIYRGYTKKELAQTLGISETAYLRYENGKTLPKISTLFLIAETLGCPPGWLLGDRKIKTTIQQSTEPWKND